MNKGLKQVWEQRQDTSNTFHFRGKSIQALLIHCLILWLSFHTHSFYFIHSPFNPITGTGGSKQRTPPLKSLAFLAPHKLTTQHKFTVTVIHLPILNLSFSPHPSSLIPVPISKEVNKNWYKRRRKSKMGTLCLSLPLSLNAADWIFSEKYNIYEAIQMFAAVPSTNKLRDNDDGGDEDGHKVKR